MSVGSDGLVPQSQNAQELSHWLAHASKSGKGIAVKTSNYRIVKVQDKLGAEHLLFLAAGIQDRSGQLSTAKPLTMKGIVEFCKNNKVAILGLTDCIEQYNKAKGDRNKKFIKPED